MNAISVAVATLDRPEALARCLDAILAGERLPAEIVVVDQGSDPGTAAVVRARTRPELPIRYLRQPRLGLSASRNAALAQASQPIVAITDDDCVPDPRWVAAIVAAFALPSQPDAVTGRVLPLGPDQPGLHVVSSRGSTTPAEFHGRVIPWFVGTGGNFALKREWFERLGGYDRRLGAGSPGQAAEEMDFFYRLLKAGARIRYEPEVVIFHERQSLDRRLASRSTYGHGIGAFCALCLRQRDPFALAMLGQWLRHQGGAIVGALRERRRDHLHQRLLTLRGTLRGLGYGLRVPADRAGTRQNDGILTPLD